MILADKIMHLRKREGWTQEDLAAELHVSRQAISKWESAQSIPDITNLQRMSELFRVSLDELVREDVPLPEPEELPGAGYGAGAGFGTGTAGSVTAGPADVATPGAPGHSANTPGSHIYGQQSAHAQKPSRAARILAPKPPRRVSLEEAQDYLLTVRQNSRLIALGVAMLVLSTAPIALINLTSGEPGFPDWGGFVELLGLLLVLLVLVPAVMMFIIAGGRLAKYKHLSSEPIETAYGVQGLAAREKESFTTPFFMRIGVAVGLCVLGVACMVSGILLAEEVDSHLVLLCAGMFLFSAPALHLFIVNGLRWQSYNKLLEEGDYTRRGKVAGRWIGIIASVYWPLATLIYLLLSFIWQAWEISWVVWPVAGVLFGIVASITAGVARERS